MTLPYAAGPEASRRLATSALPHAPTFDDEDPPAHGARHLVARTLRAVARSELLLAERVDPRPAPAAPHRIGWAAH